MAGTKNVVRYHNAWLENQQLHIQMEVCECTLHEKFVAAHVRVEEATLVAVLHQIGKALRTIHARGLAHLDVKPDNIYCKQGRFLLGDFGLAFAQKTLSEGVEPMEGDGRYASPEVIQGFSQVTPF